MADLNQTRRGLRLAAILGAAAALLAGCGDGTEGTQVATSCAESNLIEQCPPGSDPRLDAAAQSMCEASGEADFLQQNGSFTGKCEGDGTCTVLCQFLVPCDCGVDRITDEGVFCIDCGTGAACGNGVCEAGETPESCVEDCAAVCESGRQRCNGNAREECNLQGRWEMLACPTDETCRPSTDEPGEVVCAP